MKKFILGLILINFIFNPSVEASYFIRNGVPAQIQIQAADGTSLPPLSKDSSHALTIPSSSFPIIVTSTIDGLVSPALTYTIQAPGCHIIWWNMDTGNSAKLYSTPLIC